MLSDPRDLERQVNVRKDKSGAVVGTSGEAQDLKEKKLEDPGGGSRVSARQHSPNYIFM